MAEESSSGDENGQEKETKKETEKETEKATEKGSGDQGAKSEGEVMQQVKHVCPEESPSASVEEALVSLLKRDATFTFATSQSEFQIFTCMHMHICIDAAICIPSNALNMVFLTSMDLIPSVYVRVNVCSCEHSSHEPWPHCHFVSCDLYLRTHSLDIQVSQTRGSCLQSTEK